MTDETARKFAKELNCGTTSLAVLALIVRSPKPIYGYEIGMQLASMLDEGLPMNQGALYPVLRSLEKSGLLTSSVEPSVTGPPRRYYSPTAAGRESLLEWKKTWVRTRNWLDLVLESKHGTRRRNSTSRL